MSRIEAFLKAISSGDVSNLPKPQSRVEYFLKGIATGDTTDLPKPQSRIEECLDYIARNGSSGGGNNSGNDYGLHNITVEQKIKAILDTLGKVEEKISIEVVEA